MLSSKKIAVLMGGPGSERQVSLASGNAVLKALRGLGLDAEARGCHRHHDRSAARHRSRVQRDPRHLRRGRHNSRRRSNVWASPTPVPACDSSRTAFDKNLAKAAFVAAGVPTPRAEIIDVSDGPRLPSFAAPFVVKPPREGSSVGVHIVRDPAEADAAMADAAKYGNEILVEEFIAGKELTVGILNDVALPVVHIAPRDGFYDLANKYPWMSGGEGSDYYLPRGPRRSHHPRRPGRRARRPPLARRGNLLARRCAAGRAEPPVRARGQHHPRHDGNQPAAQSRRRHRHSVSRTVQDDRRTLARTPRNS